MLLVPFCNIQIPKNRWRRNFDEARIAELADSIHRLGLINLPVVRKTQTDGIYELVAGERRSRAMVSLWNENKQFRYMGQVLPTMHLPAALDTELDESLAREVELEENTIRVDLSWQERAQAVEQLHKLRLAKNPDHKIADTAEQVTGGRSNQTAIRNRILLAENLDRPRVASAPNEKEALKILQHELRREFEVAYGRQLGEVTGQQVLKNIDAIQGMKEISNETFDVILTDPPYGANADKFDAEMTTKHYYDDDWNKVAPMLFEFAGQAFRIACKQAHIYVFCDVLHFLELKNFFEIAGWDVWPRPLIWHKDVGHIPRPHHGPKRVYECILYAIKGDKEVNALYEDVIVCPAVKDKHFAAEKPVALYVELLKRSISPGSKVIDPFCGSGTIFEAANQLKIEAWGFDIDPAAIAVAVERIDAGNRN